MVAMYATDWKDFIPQGYWQYDRLIDNNRGFGMLVNAGMVSTASRKLFYCPSCKMQDLKYSACKHNWSESSVDQHEIAYYYTGGGSTSDTGWYTAKEMAGKAIAVDTFYSTQADDNWSHDGGWNCLYIDGSVKWLADSGNSKWQEEPGDRDEAAFFSWANSQ